MVESFPAMREALGIVPSPTGKKKKKDLDLAGLLWSRNSLWISTPNMVNVLALGLVLSKSQRSLVDWKHVCLHAACRGLGAAEMEQVIIWKGHALSNAGSCYLRP